MGIDLILLLWLKHRMKHGASSNMKLISDMETSIPSAFIPSLKIRGQVPGHTSLSMYRSRCARAHHPHQQDRRLKPLVCPSIVPESVLFGGIALGDFLL